MGNVTNYITLIVQFPVLMYHYYVLEEPYWHLNITDTSQADSLLLALLLSKDEVFMLVYCSVTYQTFSVFQLSFTKGS